MKPFMEQLNELKGKHDVSFRDLDKKTDISGSYWQQVATGKIPASMKAMEAAAQAFEVDPSYFDEWRIMEAQERLRKYPSAADIILELESDEAFLAIHGMIERFIKEGLGLDETSIEQAKARLGRIPGLAELVLRVKDEQDVEKLKRCLADSVD